MRIARRAASSVASIGCVLSLLLGASGLVAPTVGALGWSPAALAALGSVSRALPLQQPVLPTASGGQRLQLIEVSAADSKAGVRPFLATIRDACGVRWEVRSEVAPYATAMINDAARASVRICVVSAFRSFAQQAEIRERSGCSAFAEPVRSACVYDWTSDQVVAAGMGRSARPGYSRHQQGFAIDVSGLLPGTALGNWVAANAHRYGLFRLGDRGFLGPDGTWSPDDSGHLSIDAG